MTDDTLAKARAVLARLGEVEGKATPGPWATMDSVDHDDGWPRLLLVAGDEDWQTCDKFCQWGDDDKWLRGERGEPGRHEHNHQSVAVSLSSEDADDAAAIVALRNAAPALLRLAEAVGRLDADWNFRDVGPTDEVSECVGCYATAMQEDELIHAPDCPALAIDAALAELAALDDDAGEEVGA